MGQCGGNARRAPVWQEININLRNAVRRDLLTQAGLDASTINVTSLGEADLLIKTPDETPEPRNRRVEIAVR